MFKLLSDNLSIEENDDYDDNDKYNVSYAYQSRQWVILQWPMTQ